MKSILTAFFVFASLAIFTNAEAQKLGSCQIFPSNNPWNTRVDTMKVDSAHSDAYIASVGGSIHVHPDFGSYYQYGIPWVGVNSGQAMVPVSIDSVNGYPDESDPGPMPVPPNATVEYPPPLDGDGHVLVVDTSNHRLYELYQARKDQNDNGWLASSTAIFALDSNNYRPDGWTSCDAAGLPIFPGLVRLDECKAGVINHAVRFTIGGKNSNGSFKNISQKGWIFPARHGAGGTTDTNAMPMGLRLRLKASYDDSKDTGYAKVITTALKKYGMILADNGSPWYISGENDTSWPDDDISQLKAIIGSDFEAVYTGPVRTRANQYPDPVLPIPSGGSAGSISAPSLVRDTVLTGSSNSFEVLVANNGGAALTINRYSLKYGAVFQIGDSLTHSISAGGKDTVVVNFLPAVRGQAVDTLFISSSDENTPTTAVAIVGWGTRGIFHLSANPINFGSVKIGSSKTMTATVSNTGDGELDVYVNNATGTNQDFSLIGILPPASPPFTLQPGDTETAIILFAPSVAGAESAVDSLAFAPDASGEQVDTNVYLQGVGLPASSVAETASESFNFTLFPNPSSGLVTVSVTGTNGPSQIEITDPIGRNVFRQTIQSASETLDLSGLPNGPYFARLIDASGSAAQRIILAR